LQPVTALQEPPVTIVLKFIGGSELGAAGGGLNEAQQEDVKRALLASLNLPPEYTVDNIHTEVLPTPANMSADGQQVVLLEVELMPAGPVTRDVLLNATQQAPLFFRSQAEMMPWWTGVLGFKVLQGCG